MNLSPDNGNDVRKERFGRYRLRGVLGQGGMGRLYVAEPITNAGTGAGAVKNGSNGAAKIVALKRILPHLADSPQFREMFLNEARVATELKHRNIVETYEFGEVEGQCFISMEYLSGEDLAAALALCPEEKTMPVDVAVALVQQCAEGLHHAHEARDAFGQPLGLVHRDVNPWNIFVTYYGTAKLLDFGIVKNPSAGVRTVPGVFKGKYGYCAPEQFSGGVVNRQTDVFCLGIVLWECLTGRKLFQSGNEVATIDAVRSRAVVAPSAVRPAVPTALDAIVLGALERDRSQRTASARQLAESLEAFARTQPRASASRIGTWMQGLFGHERASLRNVISHGRDIETSVARLAALGVGTASMRTAAESVAAPDAAAGLGVAASAMAAPLTQPRALWSNHQSAPAPGTAAGQAAAASAAADAITPAQGQPIELDWDDVADEPPTLGPIAQPGPAPGLPAGSGRRRLTAGLAIASAMVLGFAAVRWGMRDRAEPTALAPQSGLTGALLIRTQPEGAHVMIDGDPSGRTTPTLLTGLTVGRKLRISVEKPGFAAVTRAFDVQPGRSDAPIVTLVENAGLLRFAGLPAQAQLYLDDVLVTADGPLTVPLGSHRVRVEAGGDVLLSKSIDVGPGEQIVEIPAISAVNAAAKPKGVR